MDDWRLRWKNSQGTNDDERRNLSRSTVMVNQSRQRITAIACRRHKDMVVSGRS